MDNKIVTRAADNIRILSASMVEKAHAGHPGGAMGGADFINILFSEFLTFDPSDMSWINRDRFFLDPGHMSAMLYSQQTLLGNYTLEELKNFRQWGSPTPGHPEVDVKRGVENTSGPLGQGHTMAVGAAIAERFLVTRFGEWMAHKTFAYISDGGIQEEISQGAGRIAGFLALSNLILFYDSNEIQLSTEVKEVTCENTSMKYQAWGWNVITISGNDPQQIRDALNKAVNEKEKPTLIIGRTIMGKGALDANGACFEGETSTHGMPLSEAGASFEKTIEHLGGDPKDPFVIFPEVAQYYKKVKEQKIALAAAKKAEQKQWEEKNPDLANKLALFFSGKIKELNWESIVHKQAIATRAASANVLSFLAQNVDNMIVASADLANSDKTDGFLKNKKAFKKGDFSGAFLQAGVSELTMGGICNGIALHGGLFVACGTFFVFSDYMKPVIRIAALMQVPVKFIWTHDSFRVGEDGPTHQPVEQEAQIRLLEQMKNHHGHMSLLVLRPGDAQETSIAWKMAMENTHTPTALIFSRQNVKDLPAISGNRHNDALQALKGAYIVKDCQGIADVILVASGSEVATLVDAGALLENRKNLKIRIVSAPSEGLFRQQDKTYQERVLPANIPTFGLTAGLPVTLRGLVGPLGRIYGMESFGFSAPAKILDEKLGYTPENVFSQIESYLKELKK